MVSHCGTYKNNLKIKRIPAFIIYIAVVCVLIACEHGSLLQVESIMEDDVVMADSLISLMKEPQGRRNRALYSILKTQIDYKMYRDVVNDSTIRIATDYYGKKYQNYHAAMAWYSLGCIASELGQDSTATDAYLTALQLYPDTLVRYYALAEQNLSYIFLEHQMDMEAIPLLLSCRNNSVRLNDSSAIAFCDYNIAKYLLYNRDYEGARKLFYELKDNKWMSPSTRDVPLLQLSKIELYYDHDYEDALQYIDSFLLKNNHKNPYGAAYTIKADIFKNQNLIDSALYYYRLSLTDTEDPYTICNTYRYLAEIHSIKGNQDSVTYYTKLVGEWADDFVSISNSDHILRALLKNSQTNPKPLKYQSIILKVALCFILFIVIMFLLFNIHNSNNKTSITTDKTIDAHIKIIKEYADEIKSFKHSKLFETMVSVTATHEELSGKQKTEFIKEFRNTFLLLRAYLASSYNMNDDEIDFCIYSLLGFRPKDFYTLSFVAHHRMIKYRLKGKIPSTLFEYIFNGDSI